jgi:hypothetical protein
MGKNMSERANFANIYFLRAGLCVCSALNCKRDFYAMKNYALSALALAAGLATALPAVAQQTAVRQGNETAMEMASRINACGGAFSSANFSNGGQILEVQCVGGAGLEGGLGGAAAGGAATVVAVAVLASGGSSSSTTTTSATGTN